MMDKKGSDDTPPAIVGRFGESGTAREHGVGDYCREALMTYS